MFESRFMIHKPYCHAGCAGRSTTLWDENLRNSILYILLCSLCVSEKKKILLLLRYIFIFAFFRFLLLLNLLYLLCRVLNIFVPCMNGYNESWKNNINKSLRIALPFTFDLKWDVVRVFVIRLRCAGGTDVLRLCVWVFLCVCVDIYVGLHVYIKVCRCMFVYK